MTNLFIQEPVYISIEDFRMSSTNSDIWVTIGSIITDDKIKIIISKSEEIIDALIWDFWEPDVVGQLRVFPLVELWLPLDIKQATVLLGTLLYEWGILDWNAYEWQWSWAIKSETYRWHSVSYFWTWSQYLWANRFLNEEVLTYLHYYLPSLSSNWYK